MKTLLFLSITWSCSVLACFGQFSACDEFCGSASGLSECAILADWLDIDAAYRSEFFNNARGGLDTNDATSYTGRVDLLFSADLSKFARGPGGTFLVHFQSLSGEGISDRYAGVQQRISNIDGNPVAGFNLNQVSQYWWRREFAEGLFTLKVGKILADSEFAFNTYAGDYLNTRFGWTQTIPLAAFPSPAAGVVLDIALTDQLMLKTGVFDGRPDGGNWGFSDSGDVMSLYEVRRLHQLNDNLPGDMRVGLWYHSGDFAAQNETGNLRGNDGIYTAINQQLTDNGVCHLGGTKGLAGFVHAGWAPSDRNRTREYWGGGLTYRGILSSRDSDSVGLGVGNNAFSNDLIVARRNEIVLETFYKARLGANVVLQPDIQYFRNPSGLHRNSTVVGLRFECFY